MVTIIYIKEISVPIYEYQCEACSHKFEIIQKLSDDRLTICPECKQSKLRKMVTSASFRLKGTGWYATDFKDKKPSQKPDETNKKAETTGKSDGASTSQSSESKASKSSTSNTSKKESSSDSKPTKSNKASSD
ncbi:MAG: putative FmdB family regulatory protein [Gammaproteobacteria bacterium]